MLSSFSAKARKIYKMELSKFGGGGTLHIVTPEVETRKTVKVSQLKHDLGSQYQISVCLMQIWLRVVSKSVSNQILWTSPELCNSYLSLFFKLDDMCLSCCNFNFIEIKMDAVLK